MPAYNEADCVCSSIAAVKKEFGAVCPDYEVILVDDGSRDGTGKLVESLPYGRVKVVRYNRNEGKGYAFRRGFSCATGEFTFLIDTDSEIMGKSVADYLEALRKTDIVIGSKSHQFSTVHTPVLRRFLSLGFNILERLLVGVKATDTQAGFKGMRSLVVYRVMPLMTVRRFAFDLEFLLVASLLGFHMKELPVSIDLKAKSSLRRVFRMMVDLLGIAYRLRIKHWYQKNLKTASDSYKPMIRW